MRTVDDNGVGIGYVNTVLHNCCGYEYVVVVIGKVEDDVLEVFGLHLTMTDGNTRVGDVFLYSVLQTLQVAYAIIDDIHLSVAAHLEVDSIYDYLRTECVYLCLYRIAVGRWSLNHAQIARSY